MAAGASWLSARSDRPFEMTRPDPIVAVVGIGVTGTRVVSNLAAVDGVRIAVVGGATDAAERSPGTTAIDLDHAQFCDVAVLAMPAPHAVLARRFLNNGVA